MTCDVCGGMRWISRDGVAMPCDGPVCVQERNARAANLARRDMPARYQNARLSDRPHPRYTPEQRRRYEMARDACLAMAEGRGPAILTLGGPPGSGKTHLACAVINERIARPELGLHPGLYVTVPDMLDQLRQGLDDGTSYGRLLGFRDVPLLVLDDLGAERGTDWAIERLYQVINHRYTHVLPTVITTNVPLRELSPRIADRVMDTGTGTSVAIDLSGMPSYRTGR